MNPLSLLREALATTWANKVPSALVCLIVAAMCMMTISTVGRTAAAEAQVADRINSAGARELVLTDKKNAGLLDASVINLAAALSVSDRAVGLQSPIDVHNTSIGAGATPVPAWQVLGELDGVVHLESGRMPQPGEALVASGMLGKLGLEVAAGSVSPTKTKTAVDYPVVGSFTPREPFEVLSGGLVIKAPESLTATNLHVVLTNAEQAGIAQNAVIGLLGPLPDPASVAVQSPVAMAQLHDEVVGDLGAFGRSMLYGSLGVGALLVGIVVFADILVRRKDLGRRRALGATRSTIIWLMVLRTLLPAIIGAFAGTMSGILLAQRAGSLPPLAFCFGILILALISAAASALAPATYAAHSDPVKVLRTP